MLCLPCFLVEWYRTDSTAEGLERVAETLDDHASSMSMEGSPVRLVSMLVIPADEVLFAVFEAGSEEIVAQTCQRAGLPAQRLTPAIDAQNGHPPAVA